MIASLISKNKLTLTGILLGTIGGYIYWYYWGCEQGCTIKSVWWRMSAWGAIMGGLLFSIVQGKLRQRTNT